MTAERSSREEKLFEAAVNANAVHRDRQTSRATAFCISYTFRRFFCYLSPLNNLLHQSPLLCRRRKVNLDADKTTDVWRPWNSWSHEGWKQTQQQGNHRRMETDGQTDRWTDGVDVGRSFWDRGEAYGKRLLLNCRQMIEGERVIRLSFDAFF